MEAISLTEVEHNLNPPGGYAGAVVGERSKDQ